MLDFKAQFSFISQCAHQPTDFNMHRAKPKLIQMAFHLLALSSIMSLLLLQSFCKFWNVEVHTWIVVINIASPLLNHICDLLYAIIPKFLSTHKHSLSKNTLTDNVKNSTWKKKKTKNPIKYIFSPMQHMWSLFQQNPNSGIWTSLEY